MPKRGGDRKDELREEMPADDAEGEEEAGAGVADGKRKAGAAGGVGARATGGGGGLPGTGGGGLSPSPPCCQAERCTADLSLSKRYHRRHKVCETHSKAAVVMVAGLRQRFCQQCSRFHELSEFDDAKRSCRRRLAGHNERRRKSTSEPRGEGSSRCRRVDQNGTMKISLPANTAYKHFQIR